MADIEYNFGKNAGKVWNTLEQNGSLTPNKIMKTTKLTEYDFYAAVGWLAKENKICKAGTKYTIGTCNFEPKIGKNAGKVWKTLKEIGYVDENYLPKLAGCTTSETYSALGWLAREGKISFKRVKPKKPQTRYGLKH